MAMMGMANGGPVADGLGTAISAVTKFVTSFLGGSMDSSQDTKNKQIDALVAKPPVDPKEPYYPPEVREPDSGYNTGGFVENYTYAQPQQPTMGTPFSNAASTNSQQYNSFVQPNKQRVNAADGVKVPELQYGASVGALAPMQNYVNSLLVGLPDNDPQVPLLNGALEQIQKGIVPRGFGFTEKDKNDIFPITPDEEPFSIEPAPEKAPAITVPPPLNDRAAADGGFIKLQDGDQVKKKILVV